MSAPTREDLFQHLDLARSHLEGLLPKVDPIRELYPGWTLRALMAHITGWDEDTIASLIAHRNGQTPARSSGDGFDAFNERSLASRQNLDLDQVIEECRAARSKLWNLLAEFPDEIFGTTLTASWGERVSVAELIQIIAGHEESHARDIQAWLKDPGQPLRKKGR